MAAPSAPTITVSTSTNYGGYATVPSISYPPGTTAHPGGGERYGPFYSNSTISLGTYTVRADEPNEDGTYDVAYGQVYCRVTVYPNSPSCSMSPNPATVGEYVTVRASSGNNPVSASLSGARSGIAGIDIMNGARATATIRWNGYTRSSSAGPLVVYYEPRSMASRGFSVSWGYTDVRNPSQISVPDYSQGQVTAPEGQIHANWGSFAPSYHLGRFNRYRMSIIDNDTNETIFTDMIGTNDPNMSGSGSILIPTDCVNRNCKVRLECLCGWPESGNSKIYGPASTAIFESPVFFVSAPPEISEIKYPAEFNFYSANPRLRLIFRVTNPEYLLYEKILDVSVRVNTPGQGLKTYTYKQNRSLFWSTNPVDNTDPIDNGVLLDFTVPADCPVTTGTAFQLSCDNVFMSSGWTDPYTLTWVPFEYMTQGRKLLQSDMMLLHDGSVNIVKGYSNYSSGQSDLFDKLPSRSPEGSYFVSDDIYRLNEGIINSVNILYDEVSIDSLPPQENIININQIDITTEGDYIKASSPPFEINSDTGQFTPVGNYLNYIMYVFKNML